MALPTSQLILQPFRRFTDVTVHSPTLPLLHLRHKSFSNPSVALLTSQLILQPFRRFTYVTTHFQPFRRFTYVTVHSPTLLSLLLRHKRAAHGFRWSRYESSLFSYYSLTTALPALGVREVRSLVSLSWGPQVRVSVSPGEQLKWAMSGFFRVFSEFSRLHIFIPPIFSTFNPHILCHFIFSFIYFMSFFTQDLA